MNVINSKIIPQFCGLYYDVNTNTVKDIWSHHIICSFDEYRDKVLPYFNVSMEIRND